MNLYYVIIAIVGGVLLLSPIIALFIAAVKQQKIILLASLISTFIFYITLLTLLQSTADKTLLAFSMIPVLALYLFSSKRIFNQTNKADEDILDN